MLANRYALTLRAATEEGGWHPKSVGDGSSYQMGFGKAKG